MALEHRKSGIYYYTKRRVGRRVVSEYQGAGEAALFACRIDDLTRKAQAADTIRARAELEILRRQAAATDALMDELFQTTAALTRAVLRANGYHQHKGEWRRRRDNRP